MKYRYPLLFAVSAFSAVAFAGDDVNNLSLEKDSLNTIRELPAGLEDLGSNEYVVGDMILLKNDSSVISPLGVQRPDLTYWNTNRIPYKISVEHRRDVIERAIAKWERAIVDENGRQLIDFYEIQSASEAENYVDIISINGNVSYASVGMRGGRQTLRIGEDVGDHGVVGVIMHELGHTLGFRHEHSHPDRDACLTVNWNNIEPGREDAFKKRLYHMGEDYDPLSIMHYFTTAFSKDNRSKTLEVKSSCIPSGYSEDDIGSMDFLSESDILEVTALFSLSKITYDVTLDPNESIKSADSSHQLIFHDFGQFVIYNQYGWPLWTSGKVTSADKGRITSNGRVQLLQGNTVLWQNVGAAGTSSYMMLTNSGELNAYNSRNELVWSSSNNYMTRSEIMRHNNNSEKTSPNGKVRLIVQSDGNVVLYNELGAAVWSSGTGYVGSNAYLQLNSNGELVLFDQHTNKVAWRSNGERSTTGNAHLVITDRGEIRILDRPGGRLLWSSLH